MRTAAVLFAWLFATVALGAPQLEPIVGIDAQPLAAQAQRVAQALELRGAPITGELRTKLDAALKAESQMSRVTGIQAALDPLCLAVVNINPESRVKVEPGPAARELLHHGWRVFLIKVHNEAGVTAPLRVSSPNALNMLKSSTSAAKPAVSIPPEVFEQRWLELATYDDQPLGKTLSGFEVEYRIIELYSRDPGKREAKLEFDVGQGTQDLGFRNELYVLFEVKPSVEVTLEIIDHDGKPTTGQFVFTDEQGRVYPTKARRIAPDLYFHDQIYRHHGEHVLLPPGKFKTLYTRGPEYRVLEREITVPAAKTHRESFRLQRWIKLTDLGWYSGDHHIHAAGCKHYESPSEGVQPADMMRHILGEDLNVGCVLSWGPCWYFQKQFFDGKIHRLSLPSNLMRYDVEVSGFPSSHAGHLCLLRLKEDDYPGTSVIEEWPSWDLPVLRWGKEQGGVVGFSHSGWGLQAPATKLPTLDMPKFDGIGANEYVVDTVHGVCDFISTVDTPVIWELSIWYHTLNCGMTTRISGETDFPCIYGERVGLGRSYVKLDPQAGLDYDRWADGIRDGRCYVSDGLGHLPDFSINGLAVGEAGAGGRKSVLAVKRGEPLKINVRAAALLAEKPREDIRSLPLDKKPYWHIERARSGDSRKVPVELIVNGHSVEQKLIDADGDLEGVTFNYQPKFSSWIAVRIFPSAHTNPVFVEVDSKPIRASKSSARWCLDAVDVCWKQKVAKIRASEQAAAAAAYDVAREAYRLVLAEANDD
jgi:hypothetical protein